MRDGLALVTGMVRESGRLLAEWVSDRGGLPARAAAITPQWLTQALQAQFPGASVRALEPLDAHAGTSDRARLGVAYGHPGTGPAPPPSVFIKAVPQDTKQRLFVNLMRLGTNEVRFYREIAPAVAIQHPHLYYAGLAGPAQRFVLVLEDLAARGATFLDASAEITEETARQVVGQLARLHATFWNSPRLQTDLAWLRAPNRRPNAAVERYVCAAAVEPGLQRFAELIPAALRHLGPRIMSARDQFEAVWARGPLTVVHGDAHLGNMYFLPEGVGLLDWQVAQSCQGMRDLAYFLIGSVPLALRRARQRELLEDYLTTLRTIGVPAPTFEEAWMLYRLHAPWALMSGVVTCASPKVQPEAVARAVIARTAAAVLELDPLGALEAVS